MVEIGRPSLLSHTCVFGCNTFGSCVKNNSVLFDLISTATSVKTSECARETLKEGIMVGEEFRCFHVVDLEAVESICIVLSEVSNIQEISRERIEMDNWEYGKAV